MQQRKLVLAKRQRIKNSLASSLVHLQGWFALEQELHQQLRNVTHTTRATVSEAKAAALKHKDTLAKVRCARLEAANGFCDPTQNSGGIHYLFYVISSGGLSEPPTQYQGVTSSRSDAVFEVAGASMSACDLLCLVRHESSERSHQQCNDICADLVRRIDERWEHHKVHMAKEGLGPILGDDCWMGPVSASNLFEELHQSLGWHFSLDPRVAAYETWNRATMALAFRLVDALTAEKGADDFCAREPRAPEKRQPLARCRTPPPIGCETEKRGGCTHSLCAPPATTFDEDGSFNLTPLECIVAFQGCEAPTYQGGSEVPVTGLLTPAGSPSPTNVLSPATPSSAANAQGFVSGSPAPPARPHPSELERLDVITGNPLKYAINHPCSSLPAAFTGGARSTHTVYRFEEGHSLCLSIRAKALSKPPAVFPFSWGLILMTVRRLLREYLLGSYLRSLKHFHITHSHIWHRRGGVRKPNF